MLEALQHNYKFFSNVTVRVNMDNHPKIIFLTAFVALLNLVITLRFIFAQTGLHW